MNSPSLSIYVHIPFCRNRCTYCDFNTYAGKEKSLPSYISALLSEIDFYSHQFHEAYCVHTIYFGGGTPTLLSTSDFERIIEKIVTKFTIADQVEISTEGNPTSLTEGYLNEIHEAGVNRLSLGMQSSIPDELQILGRTHSAADVRQSIESAKNAGLNNTNLDLIYGIPQQTLASFKKSLEFALDLEPEHLSIYGLGLEEGTPLARMIQNNLHALPDEEESAAMYEYAMDKLKLVGYAQYEISNWALSGNRDYRCTHNLQYWRNQDYLGIGAGAHSHVGNKRWHNLYEIEKYTNAANNTGKEIFSAVEEVQLLSDIDQIKEGMMMGFRLVEEGVNISALSNHFGIDVGQMYKKEFSRLVGFDLIQMKSGDFGERVCLTRRGMLLGNQVFQEFV